MSVIAERSENRRPDLARLKERFRARRGGADQRLLKLFWDDAGKPFLVVGLNQDSPTVETFTSAWVLVTDSHEVDEADATGTVEIFGSIFDGELQVDVCLSPADAREMAWRLCYAADLAEKSARQSGRQTAPTGHTELTQTRTQWVRSTRRSSKRKGL